jgi:hypothetical protein
VLNAFQMSSGVLHFLTCLELILHLAELSATRRTHVYASSYVQVRPCKRIQYYGVLLPENKNSSWGPNEFGGNRGAGRGCVDENV